MEAHTFFAERAEQAVWSNLWRAVKDDAKSRLGIKCIKYLDAECLMAKGIPDWLFNRVLGLGLEKPINENDIDNLMQLYAAEGVPVCISLHPDVQAKDIDKCLITKGFAISNYWVKMVRNNTRAENVSCDLQIKSASEDQEGIIADIVVSGFGLNDELRPVFGANAYLDNHKVYIAWDDEKPAAIGILSIYNGVGHLNTAATLPEYRGKGVQSAMITHRINAGINLGCRYFVSETWLPGDEPNHSFNNLKRNGFELAYKRPNWVKDSFSN